MCSTNRYATFTVRTIQLQRGYTVLCIVIITMSANRPMSILKSILKVVTVDDSVIITHRLQAILTDIENVGFAGNATSIASALSLIDRELPQVVILDINLEADMPSRNGIDLLVILRKKFKHMKIIMLTNLTQDQYRNTCLFLGADYYLDKSNEFERIADIIGGLAQNVIGDGWKS
jgi:DNA-binding NarL/FixJ family response regulator